MGWWQTPTPAGNSRNTQLNSTQLNSTQLNSTQLNSTQLNSTQLNSTQLYIEPFVGAGAVLFDVMPSRAVINDTNALLITCYRVIRQDVHELIERLEAHAAAHTEDYFYTIRAEDRDESYDAQSPVAQAARLIYLNKTCFNGLYRVNRSGYFNTPYGAYRDPVICDAPVLRAVHCYLRDNDVTILHGDYTIPAREAPPGALVYFDPPYHTPNQRNFTQYAADGFTEANQVELAAVFRQLSAKGVDCLLSNSDTPLMHALYADFHIDIVRATRAINARASERGAVNEVLIRNWS